MKAHFRSRSQNQAHPVGAGAAAPDCLGAIHLQKTPPMRLSSLCSSLLLAQQLCFCLRSLCP